MLKESTNSGKNNLTPKQKIVQLQLKNQELESMVLQNNEELTLLITVKTNLVSEIEMLREIVNLRREFHQDVVKKGMQAMKTFSNIEGGNKAAVIFTELQFN